MKCYLDSNVYISSARKEIDPKLNILFHYSDLFFAKCRTNKVTLVLSRLFFDEIGKTISLNKQDILQFMNEAKINYEIVEEIKQFKKEALRIQNKTGLHLADSFHAAIACSSQCQHIITWNKKDFEKTETILPCLTPEEFISIF